MQQAAEQTSQQHAHLPAAGAAGSAARAAIASATWLRSHGRVMLAAWRRAATPPAAAMAARLAGQLSSSQASTPASSTSGSWPTWRFTCCQSGRIWRCRAATSAGPAPAAAAAALRAGLL